MSPQSNPSQSSWRFGQIHQIEFPIVVVRKPQYFGVVDGVSVLVTKILRPKKSWPEGWSTGARLAVRSAPVPARRSPEGRVPLRHQQAPCWSPVVFLVNRRAVGGAQRAGFGSNVLTIALLLLLWRHRRAAGGAQRAGASPQVPRGPSSPPPSTSTLLVPSCFSDQPARG